MCLWKLPTNLEALWSEEDQHRPWAIEKIRELEHLRDQVDFIEAYMDCVETARKSDLTGDRKYALGGLFLRTFDDFSHALRRALSGDYHGSVMVARDLLETGFLIDYLMEDETKPEDWLKCDEQEYWRKYNAKSVRDSLDRRDGFKERKRAKRFDMLSKLGAHPHPKSFSMKIDGTKTLRMGPFKHKEMLRECIEEVSRCAVSLSFLVQRFSLEAGFHNDPSLNRLALQTQKICEKYFSTHPS